MNGNLNKMTFIQKERAERNIKDFDKALMASLELIGDGVWIWDMENSQYYFSPAFYTMLGYKPYEFPASFTSWQELLDPQDKETITGQVQNSFYQESNRFELEYRLKTKFGSFRWVLSKGMVIDRDDSGRPLRVAGSNTDITERRKAIKSLRESEERYRNLYEKSPLIYQALDKDGYIIDVNSAWLKAMGFNPREVIARWFGDFLIFHYREQFKEDYAKTRSSGELRNVQYELQRKDKSRLFAEIDIKVAFDNQDRFLQSHCVIRDITEHKRIEESLRKMTDRLQSEQRALTEKNIALRQVLKHIEKDRQNYRHRLGLSIEESIYPLLKRMRNAADSDLQNDIDEIHENLEAIVEKDIDHFKEKFDQLTPRETEMCLLIREGMTSKEISSELNLSVVTVHKHRELIRKKLGLANKRVNLAGYLKSRVHPHMNIDLIDDN